ncbi:MAG: hypothetical protein IT337_18630 [Thermomicrobiales bacterium]|nr:hypothetical protein [Thermomicrobiales bacterium]
MRQIVFALRFTGRAEAVGPNGSVLRAATTAPSAAITSVVSPEGLTGDYQPVGGGEATFESEVVFTGETCFLESGSIAFGAGNTLRFSTVGQGYLGPAVDPRLKHGVVAWRVDGGEGQFAGASGLIASNFTVAGDLSVVDNQCGVVFVV